MAKKKSASGFNMAAEIRSLLEQNRALSGKEVYLALKKKFPRQKINESSCGVAFSNARKKLGIVPGKKSRRRSAKKKVVRKRVPAAVPVLNLSTLQAAAKYVAEVGNVEKAIEAVRQIRSLQIR